MNKAIAHILTRLEEDLSADFVYHSVAHTTSVINAALRIAKKEILVTAAAFHDSGFLKKYDDHEENSCLLAEEILVDFGFNSQQIQTITKLIMATKIPQNANGKLEAILCDADLDYIASDCYHTHADLLVQEKRNFGASISDNEWIDMQILFLKKHKFWTESGKKEGNPIKKRILLQLEDKRAISLRHSS